MYRYPNISHLNTGEGFEKKIMMGSGTVTARDILEYEEIDEPLICLLLCCMHEEALEMIEELLSLGIIEKNKNGRYKVINLD